MICIEFCVVFVSSYCFLGYYTPKSKLKPHICQSSIQSGNAIRKLKFTVVTVFSLQGITISSYHGASREKRDNKIERTTLELLGSYWHQKEEGARRSRAPPLWGYPKHLGSRFLLTMNEQQLCQASQGLSLIALCCQASKGCSHELPSFGTYPICRT